MDEKYKLVSVAIQAYNSDDTIVRTLDSVKAQDYPRIELIITDDCSRDNTVHTVKKWIKENKNHLYDVKLITSDVNTGIVGNSNRALKQASGKYIEFLAADDFMAPDAISQYVSFCEEHPDQLPIAKVKLFSDEDPLDENVQKYCERCYALAGQSYKEQYRQLLVKNWIVAPAAAFFPVELMKRFGGYDEAYRWMEDYPFSLKCMSKGYGFGLIDKELIYYRISGQSITGSSMTPLKKDEARLFFKRKMWYMFGAGMGWEAVKQSRYWFSIMLKRCV